MNGLKGVITTIQRMSIHDGPGIRSTVFLKGCNMRCKWCHNPETWMRGPQLMQTVGRCIGCGACTGACPEQAISVLPQKIAIDRAACIRCGTCAAACPSGALVMTGRKVGVEEVVDVLKEDAPFYRASGGGITISGGEPMMQRAFALALLETCRKEGMHTAMETNLNYPAGLLEDFIPVIDLWLVDVKTADAALHKTWTGTDNEQVVANLEYLGHSGVEAVVRTPVVPTVNDHKDELAAIDRLISALIPQAVHEMIPFHTLGFDKFHALGMKNPMGTHHIL